MHVDPWSLFEKKKGRRWGDDWQATCNTSCRDQTREGSVNKEEDCTMLSVDGGFSIKIIFDHSLWRWGQTQRKENGRSQYGRERKKEREWRKEAWVSSYWKMRYFEEAKGGGGRAVELDSTYFSSSFCFNGTSETSALLIQFMQHIQIKSVSLSLLNGRLFDAEQFNDTQMISETTHGIKQHPRISTL